MESYPRNCGMYYLQCLHGIHYLVKNGKIGYAIDYA